jgi:hypothetical protein
MRIKLVGFTHPTRKRTDLPAALALAATVDIPHIFNDVKIRLAGFTHPTPEETSKVSSSLVLAAMAAGCVYTGLASRIEKARWRRGSFSGIRPVCSR